MPLQLLKREDAHEFKPMLTEIEESPTSPLGRLTFWTVLAAFLFAVLWTVIAEIDIVVSARGRVIPDGHVKTLQPLETGSVAGIAIKEGDTVRKGQVLMEIDPSITEPELEASRRLLAYTRTEIARLHATVKGGDFGSGTGTQSELHRSSRTALEQQLQAREKQLAAIDEQVAQAMAEHEENIQHLATAEAQEKRLTPVQDIIPRMEFEAVVKEVISYKSKIQQAEHRLLELKQQRDQVIKETERTKADFETTHLTQLAEKERESTDLIARNLELSFKHKKQRIVAPCDGIIDKLYVHTIGGVVSPAEKLIDIMPSNTPVIIDSQVMNQDIGFVEPTLPVAIKVDTFDFQKYGMLEGKVRLVSQDSREDEKLGRIYQVYITPLTKVLLVDGRHEPLTSGMTVTTEIKVGKRKVIEFFLYPIIKNLHEGFSVR